ncbi:MAG: AAA family ATPase [Pseudomonadota bacterium]|nr:AAA family ATPase [Pseudomonadota bacterium]
MKPRLRQLIEHMRQGLVEREEPVRLALLAALSGEHLLLLGPPGTAKSELARRLREVFDGGAYFERLLTRFSVPEELFGPLSIKALEQDRYQRLTDRYLPSASIAFIDEIFKANSAILNALLTLLNEREFDNGAERLKTPLISVIGASNELPEWEELDALYDRFLIRYQVEGVSDAGFDLLLGLEDVQRAEPSAGLKLSGADLRMIQAEAQALPLADEVTHLLKGLRGYLRGQGRYVSDRRWRKLLKLLRVAAFTDHRDRVDVWDCWLLQHCLWDTPDQRAGILEWYEQHLGTDAVLNPERLTRLTDTWEATLVEESNAVRQLRNEAGDKLYLDPADELTTEPHTDRRATRDGEPLYLAPPDQEDRDDGGRGYTRDELQARFFDDHYQQCHIEGRWVTLDDFTGIAGNRLVAREDHRPHTEPVCYSAAHVRDRMAEVQSLLDAVGRYHGAVQNKLIHIDESLTDHLWVGDGFTEPAQRTLRHSLEVAHDLAQRIGRTRDGFRELPVRGQEDGQS